MIEKLRDALLSRNAAGSGAIGSPETKVPVKRMKRPQASCELARP